MERTPREPAGRIPGDTPGSTSAVAGGGQGEILPADSRFGERYLLLRKLAQGGMAEIFLARQAGSFGFEKEVVLKRLLPKLGQSPRVVEMFLTEARIAAGLGHPNIVQVYDVGQAGDSYYLTMEHVRGWNLATLCRRGLAVGRFLPLEHAANIVLQICAALQYAHDKSNAAGEPLQIVHRDVNPSNILISVEGVAKLADFGIARVASAAREEAGLLPGKLSYMSPEQIRGEVVDARSDLFSLAIVLYEITAQRRLFRGKPPEVMKRILDGRIEPPTFVQHDYPPRLEQIVLHALELHPADRYQQAKHLHDDLEDFLTDSRLRSGPLRIAEYLATLQEATIGPELELEAAARLAEFTTEEGILPAALSAKLRPARPADDQEDLDFDRRLPRRPSRSTGALPATAGPAVAGETSAPLLADFRSGPGTAEDTPVLRPLAGQPAIAHAPRTPPEPELAEGDGQPPLEALADELGAAEAESLPDDLQPVEEPTSPDGLRGVLTVEIPADFDPAAAQAALEAGAEGDAAAEAEPLPPLEGPSLLALESPTAPAAPPLLTASSPPSSAAATLLAAAEQALAALGEEVDSTSDESELGGEGVTRPGPRTAAEKGVEPVLAPQLAPEVPGQLLPADAMEPPAKPAPAPTPEAEPAAASSRESGVRPVVERGNGAAAVATRTLEAAPEADMRVPQTHSIGWQSLGSAVTHREKARRDWTILLLLAGVAALLLLVLLWFFGFLDGRGR